MKETKRCVRCLTRKATVFDGYVLMQPKNTKTGRAVHLLAGWCSRCANKDEGDFVGHWRREMGSRKCED